MSTKPRFQHDCTRCTFITSAHVLSRVVDIYRSCNGDGSYILRYSDAGDDYATVHEPREAYSRDPAGSPLLRLNYRLCQLAEELSAPQPKPLNLDAPFILSYELKDNPGFEYERHAADLNDARAYLRGMSHMVVWADLHDADGNVVADTGDLV